MAKIELKITAPKKYNMGSNDPAALLTYADTGAAVVLDTETADLECETAQKKAPINQWMADYDANKLKLTDEAAEGNYQAITLDEAMSIAGQLVKEIGVDSLQRVLKGFSSAYEASDNDQPEPHNDSKPEPQPEPAPENPNPAPEEPKQ